MDHQKKVKEKYQGILDRGDPEEMKKILGDFSFQDDRIRKSIETVLLSNAITNLEKQIFKSVDYLSQSVDDTGESASVSLVQAISNLNVNLNRASKITTIQNWVLIFLTAAIVVTGIISACDNMEFSQKETPIPYKGPEFRMPGH